MCIRDSSNHIKENPYDLIIAGRESIDYNGAMVPGMISEILDINFITNCVKLEINSDKAIAEREIEGGKEVLSCELPLIIGGQKGLVEESDLKIPNMRGIMQSRTKPLNVLDSESFDFIKSIEFSKPSDNKECIFIDENNVVLQIGNTTNLNQYLSLNSMIKFLPTTGYHFMKNGTMMLGTDTTHLGSSSNIWSSIMLIDNNGLGKDGDGLKATGIGAVTLNEVLPTGATVEKAFPKWVSDLPVALAVSYTHLTLPTTPYV